MTKIPKLSNPASLLGGSTLEHPCDVVLLFRTVQLHLRIVQVILLDKEIRIFDQGFWGLAPAGFWLGLFYGPLLCIGKWWVCKDSRFGVHSRGPALILEG